MACRVATPLADVTQSGFRTLPWRDFQSATKSGAHSARIFRRIDRANTLLRALSSITAKKITPLVIRG